MTPNRIQRLDANDRSVATPASATIGQSSGVDITDKFLDDKARSQTTNPGVEVICGGYGGVVQLGKIHESLFQKRPFPKEKSQLPLGE